jgi:hypothetical protein
MSLTYRYLSLPFRNPFDDKRVSHEDFVQFGVEVRGRLRTNREFLGISEVQMNNFTDALDQYIAMQSQAHIASASRKGASAELKRVWKTIVDDIRRKEAWVRSKYSRTSPEYVSIFPRGLAPFQQTRRGDQSTLLRQVLMSFERYAADFPGAADSLASLKAGFDAVSGDQSGKKGSLSGKRADRNMARKALAGQLHELWLALAVAHRGNPSYVKILFNVSIFNKGTNYANDKLGRLFLQVRDSEGQPVVHALVEVRTLENQIVQKGRTKAEGMYKGRKLGIGFYEVKVRQVGFAPHKERWQVFDDHDPVRDVVMVRE